MQRSLLIAIFSLAGASLIGCGGATSTPTAAEPVMMGQCSLTAEGMWNGDIHTILCPSDCASEQVWGSGPYTSDSSVCAAAIHAGVITEEGGPIGVLRVEGEESYEGSTVNGVTTASYGSWPSSFSVSAL